MKLNINCIYCYQIELQLFLTNRQYSDFSKYILCMISQDCHLERVFAKDDLRDTVSVRGLKCQGMIAFRQYFSAQTLVAKSKCSLHKFQKSSFFVSGIISCIFSHSVVSGCSLIVFFELFQWFINSSMIIKYLLIIIYKFFQPVMWR